MRAITKSEQMEQLRAELISRDICPELRAQATQLVMGDGNLDASVVFIGEAPGRNEDEKGLPFVGAAGKLLDELLSAVGMKREDVYVTNIVKYRPPNNRDPLPEEKKAFWPYLLRQLAIVQPKAVITLGRHSGAYFIPDLHISIDHGKPRRVTSKGQEFLVIPLYHPAAALYNGGLRKTLIEDFVRAGEFLAASEHRSSPLA